MASNNDHGFAPLQNDLIIRTAWGMHFLPLVPLLEAGIMETDLHRRKGRENAHVGDASRSVNEALDLELADPLHSWPLST